MILGLVLCSVSGARKNCLCFPGAAAQHKGARIAKRLNVAVPARCSLMSSAEKMMRVYGED